MSLIQLPMADIILKYNLVYLQPNKSVEKVQQDALLLQRLQLVNKCHRKLCLGVIQLSGLIYMISCC